jgi:hypothetical protein
MFQIVYVSAATREMSDNDLAALLRQSRDNNEALGLTGMLLYKNQRFMQALEGERDNVETIYYEHICRDDRHEGVVQLMGREVESRDFPDWTMGFRTSGSLDPVDERAFTPFIDPEFTPSHFTDNLSSAHQMLLDFRDVPPEDETQQIIDERQETIDRAQKRVDEAQRQLDERQEAFDEREAGSSSSE